MNVRAVFWKEWREQWWRGKPTKQFGWSMAFGAFFALFGVGMATFTAIEVTDQVGEVPGWAALSAVVSGWMFASFAAAMVPMGVVIDVVAGERERHTMETMLARPGDTKALLWGKYLSVLTASLVVLAVAGFVASVAATVIYGPIALAWTFVGILVGATVSAFGATLLGMLGFVVAARARTVKEGQQKIGFLMLPFFMTPSLVFIFLAPEDLGRTLNILGLLLIVFVFALIGFILRARQLYRRETLMTRA